MFFSTVTNLETAQPGDNIIIVFVTTLTIVSFKLQISSITLDGIISTNFGFFQYTVQDEKYFCTRAFLNCGGVQLHV